MTKPLDESQKVQRSSRPVWLGIDRRRWDHFRIHYQLMWDKRIGALEFGVYAGMVAHAELSTGECFPAASTIGAYFNISERTVRRAVKVLVDAGYVRVEHKRGKASHYFLLAPPTPDSESDLRDTETPDKNDRGCGQRVRGTPDSESDEQEPITRSNNKAKHSWSAARVPGPKTSCDECDAGWIERADGTVVQCGHSASRKSL